MHRKKPGEYRILSWILVAVVLTVFGQASILYGAQHALVWPLDGGSMKVAVGAYEVYEKRKGPIAIAPGILPQASGGKHQARIVISEGDSLTITFFADVTYRVSVDSMIRYPDGTITISARLDDHQIGTVVLTIGLDGFLITLQDMDRGLLYRVTGDSRVAAGTVTEIDTTKIPPMIR